MERILCLVIGYLFGLLQTSYIIGKVKGIDIRNHGSGNAGTTNALRVLGTKAGLLVFLGDTIKCILAILVIRLLFGTQTEDIYLYTLYAGTGAILGHNFPFYLNFKGGKGIAATAGLIIAFHPVFLPVGIFLFFGAFLLTHYVSLGSLLVYAGFMIQMVIVGELGLFHTSRDILLEMYALTFFLSVMAYWKHFPNIKRLLKGEERKTYLKKSNKGEL